MEKGHTNTVILPSTTTHVRELVDKLRPADRHEVERYGFPPNKAIWRSFKGSFMRRTAFIDGEIAAMWGVGGTLMGEIGQPWLLTGGAVEKISSLRFARIYQQEVLRMLKVFPVLVNYVDTDYTKAIRLLDIVGFEIGEPEPIGPNKAIYRKFEMRA